MIEALIRRQQQSFDPIIDARKGGVSGDAANDKALMEVIYAQKWSKNPEYMTKREAEAVSYVGEAFRGNTSITDFTAFKYFGVTEINSYDFFDCSNLKKIGISDSVLEISTYTFNSECINLQYIDVDNNNPYYESLSGILYNKGLYEMLCVPKNLVVMSLSQKQLHVLETHYFKEAILSLSPFQILSQQSVRTALIIAQNLKQQIQAKVLSH